MKFVIIIALAFVLLIPITVYGEASYEILDNRFYNQPIVCIYEPDVSNARDVIIDAWLKETELGVKFWEYELKQSEYTKKDRWNIETQIIPLKDQFYFDNEDCDVEIRFDATAPEAAYAGVHWHDGERSQIRIVYTDLEVCRTWSDDQYRYREWCYKEDYIRSKALGNIATHEFGHAIGLEHYESDDPNQNYEWSVDPYSSPSVMTLAVHYDETKNKIRQIDIDKVKEIYQYWGFGDPKETTPQEIPTFEVKNLGGFESFIVSQTEYIKERGNVKYVTIGGKVTDEAYSRGQDVFIYVTFPDGDKKELKALTQSNQQFGIQIRVDETVQTGEYTLEAKYMGYDSEKISFMVIDGMTNEIKLKEEISIPNWIRNNVKWWANGTIEDKDFVMGVQYLAQQNIIRVNTNSSTQADLNQEIPEWIRTNAKWWGDGLITDSDFVKGIQFLVQQGIIKVN